MASRAPTTKDTPIHRLGMGLSALCLVHCLALPWLLASLPLVVLAALPEALRHSEWLHAALIAPVVLVSGPVLLRGSPGRGRIALVITALAMLVGALFASTEAGEEALTVAGALLLLGGHWAALQGVHRR